MTKEEKRQQIVKDFSQYCKGLEVKMNELWKLERQSPKEPNPVDEYSIEDWRDIREIFFHLYKTNYLFAIYHKRHLKAPNSIKQTVDEQVNEIITNYEDEQETIRINAQWKIDEAIRNSNYEEVADTDIEREEYYEELGNSVCEYCGDYGCDCQRNIDEDYERQQNND